MPNLSRIIKVLWAILGLTIGSGVFARESGQLDCLIKPEMYVELGSSADGVLESLLVDKSDLVARGQIVAKLESSVEQATVDLARQKAELDDYLKYKEIQMEFARRKSARLAELYKRKVISFNEKDEADTEAAMAELDFLKAKSDQKVAEMELKRAIATLEQRTIKSPITGVVVEQLLMPGEVVDDKPILRLAQIDPLRVEVLAPTEMFGALREGMRAEIAPEIPPDTTFTATVSVVDKVIDAASGSFLIRLELPNPDQRVVGGLKCKARFRAENGKPIDLDTVMGNRKFRVDADAINSTRYAEVTSN